MISFAICLTCDGDYDYRLFECKDFHLAAECGLDLANTIGSQLSGIGTSMETTPLDETPQIGIFWRVQSADGDATLLVDCVPMAEAEIYGEFFTYGAHYEF